MAEGQIPVGGGITLKGGRWRRVLGDRIGDSIGLLILDALGSGASVAGAVAVCAVWWTWVLMLVAGSVGVVWHGRSPGFSMVAPVGVLLTLILRAVTCQSGDDRRLW
jgi:hypothetical protein